MNWAASLETDLHTAVVGREVRFFPSVGSTNDLLKNEARAGAAEGLVFVTDEQVTGRGRRGRSWTAPVGTSLLASSLLRPTWLPPHDAFLLTILAAVAAAEAVESVSGLTVDLKWPNDLHVGGRKLSGILVETELDADALHWAVIGCGINVNWNPRAVPELDAIATSVQVELGHAIDRRDLLRALLERLDARYNALRLGARSALFDAWRARLRMLGQPVTADTPHGTLVGIADDVTHDGALIIRTADGQRHIVTAGEVSVRRLEG
jgi:BirA family biotin operon repressor/biotin-[acetyl-CoA-carboxylase] ligase